MQQLNYSQRNQYRQQQHIQSNHAAKETLLELWSCVRNIIAGKEERNICCDENRDCAPPFVYPDEGWCPGKEDFENGEEEGHADCAGEFAGDSFFAVFGEVAFCTVIWQHLKGNNSGDREHH